jgi:hypothetical protein
LTNSEREPLRILAKEFVARERARMNKKKRNGIFHKYLLFRFLEFSRLFAGKFLSPLRLCAPGVKIFSIKEIL